MWMNVADKIKKGKMLSRPHAKVMCTLLSWEDSEATSQTPTFTLCTLCPQFQADFSELLGLKDYMGVMYLITLLEKVVPESDERVKVTEETLDGVEVLLYQPKQPAEEGAALRMAVIYLHGGGWCLGSSSELKAAGVEGLSSNSFCNPATSLRERESGIHTSYQH